MSRKHWHGVADYELMPDEENHVRLIRSVRPEGLPADKVAHLERRLLAQFKPHRQPAHTLTPNVILRGAFAFALVAVLILASSSVVSASTTSLPGDTLYPVKRLSENVQLVLASELERPALHVGFAENRLAEIEALSEDGIVLPQVVQDLAGETEWALSGIESLPQERQAALLERFVALGERQQAVLARVASAAPESAKDELAHAQQVSRRGLAQARDAIRKLGSNPPAVTDTPTGQPGEGAVPSRTPRPQGPPQTAPGQAFTPPGQQHTPPGLLHTPPGPQSTPPGKQKTPPGQEQTPPGQGNGGGGGDGRP